MIRYCFLGGEKTLGKLVLMRDKKKMSYKHVLLPILNFSNI